MCAEHACRSSPRPLRLARPQQAIDRARTGDRRPAIDLGFSVALRLFHFVVVDVVTVIAGLIPRWTPRARHPMITLGRLLATLASCCSVTTAQN